MLIFSSNEFVKGFFDSKRAQVDFGGKNWLMAGYFATECDLPSHREKNSLS